MKIQNYMPYYNVLNNRLKIKRPRSIFVLYWVLICYILIILLFWFVILTRQNEQITRYQLDLVDVDDSLYQEKLDQIRSQRDNNNAQYIGEGITFLILSIVGAIIVYRVINRQFMQSEQQQHFMMAITHELKTPIAVTKLNLETLQKRVLNSDQRQRLIKTTIQEANRLNALCNNMLLTSQIEAGRYRLITEPVDLVILLKDCVNDFNLRFPDRKIETRLPEAVIITGDLLLLQLAVNNLLDNAIKYSDKDGIVLLSLTEINNEIHLKVIDEGPGVSEVDKSRIFEKYYRGGQAKTKGTGLGLYLTKQIVQTHNGLIKFEKNPTGGSIFEIVLKSQKNL
jgi:two-component system, OmpR family, sensor histidine kinase CiaH